MSRNHCQLTGSREAACCRMATATAAARRCCVAQRTGNEGRADHKDGCEYERRFWWWWKRKMEKGEQVSDFATSFAARAR